jgi:FtsP/CotA-like multicopper oxidase with cupredoxin domain
VHHRLARALALAAVATAGVATGSVVAGCTGSDGGVQGAAFTNPLVVPPLAPARQDTTGRTVFDLRVEEGRWDFGTGTGPVAGTLGVNGPHLAPTLRAARGDEVVVHVDNTTEEPTTLHWHGMRVPAAMDGGPHQVVQPGERWSPHWRIDQPAATLWYHPHVHGETASQVYRGMAGFFLVDDEDAAALALPNRYGIDDVPVAVQDLSFGTDGALDFTTGSTSAVSFLGDTVATNGVVGAYFDATTELLRLRLLNASTGRVYRFAFDDGRPFQVVASDGGLLAAPVETTDIQLSPAERAELVVRLQPGETVRLVGLTPDLGARIDAGRLFGEGTFDVLELRAADALTPSAPVPPRLVDLPPPDPSTALRTRPFVLGGRLINGRTHDLSRIDEVVPLGEPEVWAVTNRASVPHNLHVHDGQFRILTLDGAPPPPVLAGWKDTVLVAPTTTVELLVRFDDHHDPHWPYMVHCHLMLHEDQGMMAQFVVVTPDQVDDVGVPEPGSDAQSDHDGVHHHAAAGG